MKSCSWVLITLILMFSAGPQFCLRADEAKQKTSATDEAKEKTAEEPKDARAELLKLLQSGSPDVVTKALDAAIEQSPDDVEIQLLRQMLVTRLMSVRKTAEAIEQAEKLTAFQLSRVQDASPVQNISLAASAQMLRSLYLREQKPVEAAKITNEALEALRSVAVKVEDDLYLPAIARLVNAIAQGLSQEEKYAKAKEEVSLETEQQMLDKFMSHHELHHATIMTPKTSEMQKQFGVTGIPHAVLIDRLGNVRMIKVGSGPANSKALHEMIEVLLAE